MKGEVETPDSPAQNSRNYVIPFSELLIEKEIGKGAYGKVYLKERKFCSLIFSPL